MVNIPPVLVEKIAAGDCVLFVGAGLSAGAKLPLWGALLDQLLAHLKSLPDSSEEDYLELQTLIKKGKYLVAAQELREKLGGEFVLKLQSIFLADSLQPLKTHELITQIKFHAILTTNYDILIESAFRIRPPVITHADSADLGKFLNNHLFYILKCHGDIEQPETIILTKQDYKKIIHDSAAFAQHIKQLFMGKTILFVGFGLTDTDFELYRGELDTIFEEEIPPHYALMYGKGLTKTEIRQFKQSDKIEIIPYDSDDHSDVQKFLETLLEEVQHIQEKRNREIWEKYKKDCNKKSPFPGLHAFTECDAPIFFGRERETRVLREKLEVHPLMIVIGASGSGKSSLVGAGFIPELRREMQEKGGELHSIRFVPGENPFDNLTEALQKAKIPGLNIATVMQPQEQIIKKLEAIRPEKDRILLFVDQFEEIFTLTEDEDLRAKFMAFLKQARNRVEVVVTMRADFYHLATRYLESELSNANLTVAQPDKYQLYEMIEKPATLAGLKFEGDLLETIVREAGDEPGNLPLLAYLLDELFKLNQAGAVDNDETVFTIAEYESLGGVQGAIGKRAEETFQKELAGTEEENEGWLNAVFSKLVTVDSSGTPTRKRATISEISKEYQQGLKAFTDARLLTTGSEESAYIEVAHEAILSNWNRLSVWIESRKVDLYIEKRMRDMFEYWKNNNRKISDLPADEQIREFKGAMETLGKDITGESEDFKEFITDETQRRLKTLAEEAIDAPYFNYLLYRLEEIGVDRIDIHYAVYPNLRAEVEVRTGAVQMMGRSNNQAFIPELIDLMEDDDEAVRSSAAEALGNLGATEAIQLLEGALEDVYNEVRHSAALALGNLGSVDSIPKIEDMLESTFSESRWAGIAALEKLGAMQSIEKIESLLHDEDRNVRQIAVRALGNLGSVKSIPKIEQVLIHDTDEWVRDTAAEALVRMESTQSIETIEPYLSDKNPYVRITVVKTLGMLEASRSIDAIEQVLRSDDDERVRQTAIDTLEILGSSQSIDAIEAALEDADWGVRMKAARALGVLGATTCIPRLEEALEDESEQVRLRATDSLKQLNSRDSVEKIIPLLEDYEWSVRRSAIYALEKLGGRKMTDSIMPLLSDSDEAVQGAALVALYHLDADRDIIANFEGSKAITLLIDNLYGSGWIVTMEGSVLVDDLELSDEEIARRVDTLRAVQHPVAQEAIAEWDAGEMSED